ncbi:unnamed protein product [Dracunculus medinensis]|uniref:CTNNB1_binding domain-containing protein n=1 Tax=Dracunculus medinensis TaxID=318479 RepID=A0A0N4U4G0_DRAME|nr:unnamed protein product [Dracunculus medinensis]
MPSTAMCLHISVRNNKNGISDEIKWNNNANGDRRDDSDGSTDDGLCEAKPSFMLGQAATLHQDLMPYGSQFPPGINLPYGPHPQMQYLPTADVIHMSNYQAL